MTSLPPFVYRWSTDHCFEPMPAFRKRCEENLEIGGLYRMELREERSQASHNQYFAAVHEAWLNLPEIEAERFPSDHHLRRWALIHTGFRDERTFACSSKEEARRLAAWVRPMDDYAVIVVKEAAVHVLTAKSQSMRAMGKAEFQRSKTAVLDYLAPMIGLSAEELTKNAGRAA